MLRCYYIFFLFFVKFVLDVLYLFYNLHNSSFGQLLKAYGVLVKQMRTPPVRPADGVVRCVYESFVPGKIIVVWVRAKIKSAEHAPAL